jgi:hypothetical protein
MALKGLKNKAPLIKTSINITKDLQTILDSEAKMLEISRSALIGGIVEDYYRMKKTDYPTWKGGDDIEQ